MRNLKTVLGTICLLAAMGSVAKADVIPTLVGGAPVLVTSGPNAGKYTWTYNVSLTNNEQMNPSLGFAQFGTLYDVGFSPIVITGATGLLAADFTFSSNFVTLPAYLTTPGDNASLYNLRYTFDGEGTIVGASNATGTDNVDLGTFSFLSTVSGAALSNYDGEAALSCCGIVTDTEDGNVGHVAGPSVVPEPASLALMGFGLLVLGGLRQRKSGRPVGPDRAD